MSVGDSNYTIGRGKPPLRTRFQKGQSGNPSGKPGPAKIARLEAEMGELKDKRLMLDAAGGDRGAMKLILSELDHEIAREEPASAGDSMTEEAQEESGEQGAAEPPPVPDYALWRKANQGE